MTDDMAVWLRQQLDDIARAALRALYWPDCTCRPPSSAHLFEHGKWVRRYVSEDSGDQIIRTATAEEGQLPQGWEAVREVPDGWIQTHEVARIAELPGESTAATWIGDHIALHGPASVLADVKAKRDMLDELDRRERDEMGWDGIEDRMRRMLAVGYAYRPGYKEEWRPDGL